MTRSPFVGEMVSLRPFDAGDAPNLLAYLNHPLLAGRRYVPWRVPADVPLSLEQVEAVIDEWSATKCGFALAVEPVGGGAVVGHAHADWDWDVHCPSVSVTVDPAHWRQGIATEAARLVIGYLFDQTVAHNVSGWYADWNEQAGSLAARLGFTVTGGMRRTGLRAGRWVDDVSVDMLRPEWQTMKIG